MNRFYAKLISEACLRRLHRRSFLDFAEQRFSFHEEAEYAIDSVDVNRIVPLCNYVYSQRLGRAAQLIQQYERAMVALFEPAQLRFPDGAVQLVAPPIVEERTGELVLCDGMHRIFLCRERGIEAVCVLVVRNVSLPLPGRLNCWEEVTLEQKQRPVEENFRDFNRAGLSGYTGIFNSEQCWAEDPLGHLDNQQQHNRRPDSGGMPNGK